MTFSLNMKFPYSVTILVACVSVLLTLPLSANEGTNEVASDIEFEISGNAALEQRYFFEKARYPQQLNRNQSSLSLEAELYWQWNDGNDSIIFTPFYRVDGQDDRRTHGDIRELAYVHIADDWELRLGYS